MILTTCKYFDLVGNRCSRVTDGKCSDLQDCEFKYIAELKAENERLKEEILKWQKAYSRQYQINENKGYNKKEEQYRQTLQEVKAIAEAPKPFIDFSETKTATEVEYDYAAICNELELRLHKVLELITKAEEE